MMSFPLLAGIAASILHVVSGPDHLAAVTPLAIETRRKVWKIGLFWGFGHLTGMLLIGLLFLLFRQYIPIEKISEHLLWSYCSIVERRGNNENKSLLCVCALLVCSMAS